LYYIGSTCQASDYENTIKFIINLINSDPIIATRENKQYEMKYKANYDECIKRKCI